MAPSDNLIIVDIAILICQAVRLLHSHPLVKTELPLLKLYSAISSTSAGHSCLSKPRLEVVE